MDRNPTGHGDPRLVGVSCRRSPAGRLPARVVHPALRMPRAVTLLRREHEFLVLAATALDHGLRDAVQDDEPLKTVLHVIPRDDEDGSVEFGNPDLPAPSQSADLVFPRAGIDLEQGHPGQMCRQLREQQPLFLHRKRIRRAFVRMALHLYQGRRVQPGTILLISPQACTQVQNPPHDRQVAVDRAWTLSRVPPVSNVGLQGAEVHLLERQCADIRIQRCQ